MRSKDVLAINFSKNVFRSIPFNVWKILQYFDGSHSLADLSLAWGKGEECFNQKIFKLISRYYNIFFYGKPKAFLKNDLPIIEDDVYGISNHHPNIRIPILPFEIDFNITYSCNLRCIYCFQNSKLRQKHKELPINLALGLLDNMIKSEIPMISITGGEPLCYPHIIEFLKEIKIKGIILHNFLTNAAAISEDVLNTLVWVQPKEIWVSLESCNPKKLDKIYQVNGVGKKILRNIKRLKASGLKVGINCTVTKYYINEITPLLDWCESNKITNFCLSSCRIWGKMSGLIPSIEQEHDILSLIDEFKYNRVNSIKNIYFLHSKNIDCSAMKYTLTLDPYGNFIPCDWFCGTNSLVMGNIFKNSIKKLWGGRDHLSLYNIFHLNENNCTRNECKKMLFMKNEFPELNEHILNSKNR